MEETLHITDLEENAEETLYATDLIRTDHAGLYADFPALAAGVDPSVERGFTSLGFLVPAKDDVILFPLPGEAAEPADQDSLEAHQSQWYALAGPLEQGHDALRLYDVISEGENERSGLGLLLGPDQTPSVFMSESPIPYFERFVEVLPEGLHSREAEQLAVHLLLQNV